jgi:argonaute-like protein implicated in RNA metabolism and viral defense
MVDTKLTTEQKRAIKRRKQELASGQTSLLELDPNNWLAEEIEADAEQLTRRNFRRALKAASMASNMPIQIATEQLWNDERRNQDEATRAWNVSVALFYKAGGIPWRMRTRVEGTCFVGISFHHRRTTQRHFVYSSLAQAFSSEGDGFAIRGDAVPWDGERVQPRLSEDQAHYLLSKVLTAYRERAGRDPLRVVVHKTSNFTPDERAGIDQALNSVPVIELLTLRPGEFRMLREGVYPPHRGTYCAINDAAFLFTSGYMPAYRTYPGPHVPAPLELVADPGVDTEAAADDVLALTKMNWNSASAFMSLPITLSFAQKVGAVMAEIPPDIDPHPSLRFYI